MPTLTVDGTGVQVTARADEPILTALARCGYAYRYGCRRGGCGICKVELVSGQVRYPVRVAADVLTDAELAGGVCLSCRAVAVDDVVIRLRADDKLRCVAPLLATLAGAGRA